MNRRLIRIVAAVAAAGVVSMVGAGLANASTAASFEPRAAAAATGQTTHSAAEYLRQLHTYLDGAARAGDVAAVEAAVKHLRPVFGTVKHAPVERAALELTDRADVQATQLERELPGLDLLAPVLSLVTGLLDTVMNLLTSLLGGLPVPLPELPIPDLPLPELPGVPLPEVPGAPEAPAPGEPAPAPEPAPGEPTPAPEPAPAPEVPEVPAPAPDVPLPDAPLPEAPLP